MIISRLEKIEKDGLRSLTEEEAAKLSEYRTRDQAARQAAMRDMHDLTQKKVRNDGLSAEEQKRYNEYLKDNQMREQRQQMEVDLRKADAEHITSTAIANEQAAAAKHAAEHARRHLDPEPGSLPAVASGTAPVGVDSSAAVENILQKERVKDGVGADSGAYLKHKTKAQSSTTTQTIPEGPRLTALPTHQ